MKPGVAICAVVAVIAVAVVAVCGVWLLTDSPSYVYAARTISQGGIDMSRTPLYPLLIWFAAWVSGADFSALDTAPAGEFFANPMQMQGMFGAMFYVVVGVQLVLMVLSVACFYRLAGSLLRSLKAVCVLTLVYAVLCLAMNWHRTIMTESLAVSGMVFWAYFALQTLRRDGGQVFPAVMLGVMTILLIALRPSFLFLPIVLLLMALRLLFTRKRVAAVVCLVGVGATAACVLAYMQAFRSNFGVRALTDVSIANRYFDARDFELLQPDEVSNSWLREYLDYALAAYPEIGYDVERDPTQSGQDLFGEFSWVKKNIGLAQVNAEVDAALARHRGEWLRKLVATHFLNKHFFDSYRNYPTRTLLHSVMEMGLLAAFIWLPLFVGLVLLLRRRLRPSGVWLWLLTAGGALVVVLGAPNDYLRLMAPVYPMVMLLLAAMVPRSRA